jgi:mRNA-degrading endonuclease RelE of RelBE toxin-antitoxin system
MNREISTDKWETDQDSFWLYCLAPEARIVKYTQRGGYRLVYQVRDKELVVVV